MKVVNSSPPMSEVCDEADLRSNAALRVIDDLERTNHLVAAAILACSSVEDMRDRNAFVALLSQIEDNIGDVVRIVREAKADLS